jgi:hypothetical protein
MTRLIETRLKALIVAPCLLRFFRVSIYIYFT